jgi:hypothetical protein
VSQRYHKLHRNGTTSGNTIIPTPQPTEAGQTNLGTDHQPSYSRSERRRPSQRSGGTTETTCTSIHALSCTHLFNDKGLCLKASILSSYAPEEQKWRQSGASPMTYPMTYQWHVIALSLTSLVKFRTYPYLKTCFCMSLTWSYSVSMTYPPMSLAC